MALIKRSQTYTQAAITSTVYSDLTTNLGVHPQKLDLYLEVNEEAVKRSITNILLTDRGERLFNPVFGSSIRGLLFENISPQTEAALKSAVENAIENFEPRASLIDVFVQPMPDENAYAVTVAFGIINSPEPIVLELLLNRIR
jgi:phage baseplate assembly protein W